MKNRDWKAFMVLSLVLPIGLMAAFRVTGVTRQPLTAQEEVADTISWSMRRPTGDINRVGETVNNTYRTTSVKINFTIWMTRYTENYEYPPSNGGDYVDLEVFADVNVSCGFVRSVNVTFRNTDEKASFAFHRFEPHFDVLDNLKINKIGHSIWGSGDAYFETIALNQPGHCLLKTWGLWVFSDENNVDHKIDSLLETVYFDGSTYRKLTMPIMLEMLTH